MFNIHTKSINTLREWLNEISYSALNRYIMQNIDQKGDLYPDFDKFMGIIDRINPFYAFIFSVFRLGQPTERTYLDTFFPQKVVDALLEIGLMEQTEKFYRMPQIGILPLEGMYFITGLPETYPTVLRNNFCKQVNQSVQLVMDEINSQPIGTNFLEFHADYGILANMAAFKGFKNTQIYPKHHSYIPFIQLNLALNNHEGKIITDTCNTEYDLITCIHFSVKEKIEKGELSITDENEIIQSFPVFCQLKERGKSILLLESIGTINGIAVNEQLKKIDGFKIQSIVLEKMSYFSLISSNYDQSSWEKQFELVPCEYENYARKTIELMENKTFVFTQLLKINKGKEPFILYPFYSPKYTDPTFNYVSLIV